jgi:hypothetical protein
VYITQQAYHDEEGNPTPTHEGRTVVYQEMFSVLSQQSMPLIGQRLLNDHPRLPLSLGLRGYFFITYWGTAWGTLWGTARALLIPALPTICWGCEDWLGDLDSNQD